jgi:hypothetical protein
MRTKLSAICALALAIGANSTAAQAEDGGWQLHGFGEVSVKNDYVTPRGLVVTTAGGTVQVLNGLVAVSPGGVAFHAGTWVDLNPGYSRADGNISTVNEFDYFVGVAADIAPGLNAGVEYSQFISGQPSVAFHDERNIEFSLKYSDAPTASFAFNPYAKLFWAFDSKSSTVVLGKAGGTFDIELGAVPTYKGAGFTLSAPSWITVGPKSYWVSNANSAMIDRDNFGVVSTGLKLSTPLSFIHGGANANVFAFGQYFHLINDGLVAAKAILNSGDHKRDQVVFGVGLGFGF